ncbi:hypothetical protein ABI59_16080 [Acidobacteria bacterium Mor1]|nr:hypothetical protein ABI59_16080 [Acidobacteria bacterium Mor1]
MRGRYAPSPTGEIHLGNASSALCAWLSIRARGGTFVMRMEDLDAGRSRPELADQLLDDLRWLGLDWDEGCGEPGEFGPYVQSRRTASYEQAFLRLKRAGQLYPCFCSRRDIAAAASAPQSAAAQAGSAGAAGDAGERLYPGTCRDLDPAEAQRRIDDGQRHAWRLRVATGQRPDFDDLVCGRWEGAAQQPPGDFVVRRSDGAFAYQLAVVADDAAMEIGEVVRGNDLLSSTPKQLLLYRALELPEPLFGHVPLLVDGDGVRLSKRQQGITLRELRERGLTAEQVVGYLAHLLGLRERPAPVSASALAGGFELAALRSTPRIVTVDPAEIG